jgi:mannose-6-phosphate isomerase-like protein (cupin superfamily)
VHRHSREDEYSYVLDGHLGAILGGEEVAVGSGCLVEKPRGQWHTFWNAGDVAVRVLEIISPGGFERAFRDLAAMEQQTPEAIAELGARYGVEIDFEATMALIERHGLTF